MLYIYNRSTHTKLCTVLNLKNSDDVVRESASKCMSPEVNVDAMSTVPHEKQLVTHNGTTSVKGKRKDYGP